MIVSQVIKRAAHSAQTRQSPQAKVKCRTSGRKTGKPLAGFPPFPPPATGEESRKTPCGVYTAFSRLYTATATSRGHRSGHIRPTQLQHNHQSLNNRSFIQRSGWSKRKLRAGAKARRLCAPTGRGATSDAAAFHACPVSPLQFGRLRTLPRSGGGQRVPRLASVRLPNAL